MSPPASTYSRHPNTLLRRELRHLPAVRHGHSVREDEECVGVVPDDGVECHAEIRRRPDLMILDRGTDGSRDLFRFAQLALLAWMGRVGQDGHP
jgi:hypothetical protein